jgi:hypothetical protein
MEEQKKSRIEQIKSRYMDYVTFNDDQLEEKLITATGEYAYFQNIFYETSKKSTDLNAEVELLWTAKFREYKFDYDMKLSNAEIKTFIEKDRDVILKRVEVKKIDDFLEYLEHCLKNLGQLRWDLKNLVKWKEFQGGKHL